ncbi:hypothetical protein BS78_08G139300 [Paspalum vaginatum]|nr:hypothetical protein BS78_08G139300 [Paspalum vaginatum]
MGRLEIDWKKVFGATSSPYSERDICFGDPLPAAKRARAAGLGRAARASSSGEQQSQGTHRAHQKFDRRRVGERRRRAQVADTIVAAALALQAEAAAWGTDVPPAADENAGSSSAEEDERREHASPSAALGGEKNHGHLHMHASERRRQGGQTDPIAVDKMYSSQPCCAALSGRNRCRVHAVDAEESDHEECRKSEKPTFSCCAKSRSCSPRRNL